MKRTAMIAVAVAATFVSARAHAAEEPRAEAAPPGKITGRFATAFSQHNFMNRTALTLGIEAAGGYQWDGGPSPGSAIVGVLRYEHGETSGAIGVRVFELDVRYDFLLGRLRLGVGAGGRYFAFVRATTGDWVGAPGLSAHVGASFDLVRFQNGGGVYAGGDFQGTWMFLKTDWGPRFTLGVRF